MIYEEKDPRTGDVSKNDLSILPYISIPKDTLIMASELLRPEEFGNVMYDVVNEIFCNCEYEKARKSRTEEVIFERMVDNIGRLSKGYFKKVKNLKNQDND